MPNRKILPMLHKKRTWTITEIATLEELAEKLTAHTWTGCTGFRLGHVLFLNNSTSADGAQEYAVLYQEINQEFYQIESITFSWCTKEKALEYINDCVLTAEHRRKNIANALEAVGFSRVCPRIELSNQHCCPHCA